jgi:uncharacterized damage-inducible protein DinB
MNWNQLIKGSLEYSYMVTEGLVKLVEDGDLTWKPSTGGNWMTTGQLLRHVAVACGSTAKGFVTGDWGMPEGFDVSDMSPEEMLPSAEKLPTVENLAEAKKLLAEDKKTAFEMLDKCSEEDLDTKIIEAPWDDMKIPLGQRFLQCVEHLNSHKGQLFYYLKLQGKPVNTHHLWGM